MADEGMGYRMRDTQENTYQLYDGCFALCIGKESSSSSF
jgi:hypothetical protein